MAILGNLREPQIKAALIDALFAHGMVDADTVLVSEMPVVHMSRRADIVLANGHLVGFEIKSDADSTARLLGQLEAYQRSFEGIVIVTGARHLQGCLAMADASVGIIAVEEMENGAPKARIVRKPHLRRMSPDTAIRQMRADELYQLTRSMALNPWGARDRHTLERLAKDIPISSLRDAALKAIKRRYRPQFEAFRQAREQAAQTVEALYLLKRPSWEKRRTSAAVNQHDIDCRLNGELGSLSLYVHPRRIG